MQNHSEGVSQDTFLALKLENAQLIKELHKLQAQMEVLYNTKVDIKPESLNSNLVTEPQVYYGAVDKIKSDLPYKLGSKIINTPLKPTAIIKLPKDLLSTYKKFNKDNHAKANDIDLSQYKDGHEAVKVKNHLSYKVGNTLLEGFSSPKKFIMMPFKLSKEVIDFKLKK